MEQHFLGVETQLDPQLQNNLQLSRLITGMIETEDRKQNESLDLNNENIVSKKSDDNKSGNFGVSSNGSDLAPSHSMLQQGSNYGDQYQISGLNGGDIYANSIEGSNGLSNILLHHQQQQQQQLENLRLAEANGVASDDLHYRDQIQKNESLMMPIPPLHVQQQIVNKEHLEPGKVKETAVEDTEYQMLRSSCTRCKKEFDQPIIIPQTKDNKKGAMPLAEPKIFKLCQHCRDLQRKRSRRWQKKTKDKTGSCRRCGTEIPVDQQRFVLCPSCRENLRTRKANRAAQGKCVHCSGPLDTSIITSGESGKTKDRIKSGNFKVCQRCRENDKIRRMNLEKKGHCNRCAKSLDPSDIGRHKVCVYCRTRKKRSTIGSFQPERNIEAARTNVELAMLQNSPMGMEANELAAMAMLSGPGFSNSTQSSLNSQYSQSYHQQAQLHAHAQAQIQAQQQYMQSVAQSQTLNQAMTMAQAQAHPQSQYQTHPHETPQPQTHTQTPAHTQVPLSMPGQTRLQNSAPRIRLNEVQVQEYLSGPIATVPGSNSAPQFLNNLHPSSSGFDFQAVMSVSGMPNSNIVNERN